MTSEAIQPLTNDQVREKILKAVREEWRILDLAGSGLHALPPEIGKASAVRRLHLNANALTELPHEIGALENLQELYLHDNHLLELPDSLSSLRNLRHLRLDRNCLVFLPETIGRLESLLDLVIKDNRLVTIPETLGALAALRVLDISSNQLTYLPDAISKLASLEGLNVHNNRLMNIPVLLGDLQHLRNLNLSNNALENIPDTFARLTNLSWLSLADNKLIALPHNFGELRHLQFLDLSKNRLATLPRTFGDLRALQDLSVSANSFSSLPSELGGSPDLRHLEYSNNPLQEMSPELLKQGYKAVLAYLRASFSEGTNKWVSKLLLVGQGGVGKTSLLRQLRAEPFDVGEASTRGIEVSELVVPHPTLANVAMQLNTWDFAGQEIYHATHQFFLTNRSLFLLMWNARHGYEQGKLYSWLDLISNLAPQSPIIIVATHVDQRDADFPFADLQRRYPSIAGECAISNLTGAGIGQLKVLLSKVSATLPLMGERWPRKWLDAAQAVRGLTAQYTTPRKLVELSTSYALDVHEVDILLQWMHDLGDILFFKHNSSLNDIVILKPQWVTDHIGRVLESDEVTQRNTIRGYEILGQHGILTRSHLQDIWSEMDIVLQDYFLRLMEQFDLSYRTLQSEDISIVVERLSHDAPDYQSVWDNKLAEMTAKEVVMKFVFDTSIPAGIPTWFIARSHRFTTYLHWRYGALFQDGGGARHLALIEAFPHHRYLRLSVRGPWPHNFFCTMRDGLDLTLSRFPGLKVRKLVPCYGHSSGKCEHEFDLSHLENALEKKPAVLEIQCPVSFELVSVLRLLFGLDSRTHDLVLERLEKLNTDAIRRHELLREEITELRALAQREFLAIYRREQEDVDSQCPNVFTLDPGGDPYIQTLLSQSEPAPTERVWREIILQELVLQLFCQMPGRWHPTEEGGRYKLRQGGPWLQAISPFLSKMLGVLKHSAPFVQASADFVKSAAEFSKQVDFMKKLLEALQSERISFDSASEDTAKKITGSGFRLLRSLLERLDPRHEWGGLHKILTPEGHILWLCDRHSAEFRS